MMIPDALAAAATGDGGMPDVVFPSVNITITLAFVEDGSKDCIALEKASAWLVVPEAVKLSMAALSEATEVVSGEFTVAAFKNGNKCFGTGFHIIQRAAGHTSGTIQN